MSPTLTINRYGSIASDFYDIDKPDFALPETAFHLERFRGFADISADGGYDRSRGMRSGDRGWTFEARKP